MESDQLVTYSDLRRARAMVLKAARRVAPGVMSFDTTGPSVASGLEVVQFEVPDTTRFATEIAGSNLYRINEARGRYAMKLFAAAIATGITYGSMAERRRSGISR